jgi:ectoine hydroxylase-related dioxygenase (phytanoyl-CoA dioxygenase family)
MIHSLLSPIDAIHRDGFAIVADVVDPSIIDDLVEAFDRAGPLDAMLRREEEVYGMRDLLRAIPAVRRLAGSPELVNLVDSVLGPGSFAVRGLLFDKTTAANWSVPWHQDLTIAVRSRMDAPGYGPWNVKAGIPHVRPPIEVLEKMLTVRLHLDDCQAGQGPLRVLAGSHREGKLGVEATRDWLERQAAVACLVGKGGVVLMRPLLLHASSAATEPSRRRVIHLEYANTRLPEGVDWFEAVERGVP